MNRFVMLAVLDFGYFAQSDLMHLETNCYNHKIKCIERLKYYLYSYQSILAS